MGSVVAEGNQSKHSATSAMLMKAGVEVFDPSEFEEPELYESMKILKKLEFSLKSNVKKTSLLDLKKSINREKKKEKEKIKIRLKRPYLDLEKMLKMENQLTSGKAK